MVSFKVLEKIYVFLNLDHACKAAKRVLDNRLIRLLKTYFARLSKKMTSKATVSLGQSSSDRLSDSYLNFLRSMLKQILRGSIPQRFFAYSRISSDFIHQRSLYYPAPLLVEQFF